MIDVPPHLRRKASRLLARIHRRYQTRAEVVHFGDVSFNFTRIADPERVLDDVAEEETRRTKIARDGTITFKGEPLRMPYWAELWESAEAISQWLVDTKVEGAKFGIKAEDKRVTRAIPDHRAATPASTALLPLPLLEPQLPNPTSALDLGCGMGLAGCAAAACGYAVTFADIEAPSLLFAEFNALPFPNVKCRRTNWQTDQLGERFDLIIGADILYERTQWDFLEPFWRAHLTEGGTVLLGEPGRPTGEPFAEWAAERGWTVSLEKRKVVKRAEPIRLLKLGR